MAKKKASPALKRAREEAKAAKLEAAAAEAMLAVQRGERLYGPEPEAGFYPDPGDPRAQRIILSAEEKAAKAALRRIKKANAANRKRLGLKPRKKSGSKSKTARKGKGKGRKASNGRSAAQNRAFAKMLAANRKARAGKGKTRNSRKAPKKGGARKAPRKGKGRKSAKRGGAHRASAPAAKGVRKAIMHLAKSQTHLHKQMTAVRHDIVELAKNDHAQVNAIRAIRGKPRMKHLPGFKSFKTLHQTRTGGFKQLLKG